MCWQPTYSSMPETWLQSFRPLPGCCVSAVSSPFPWKPPRMPITFCSRIDAMPILLGISIDWPDKPISTKLRSILSSSGARGGTRRGLDHRTAERWLLRLTGPTVAVALDCAPGMLEYLDRVQRQIEPLPFPEEAEQAAVRPGCAARADCGIMSKGGASHVLGSNRDGADCDNDFFKRYLRSHTRDATVCRQGRSRASEAGHLREVGFQSNRRRSLAQFSCFHFLFPKCEHGLFPDSPHPRVEPLTGNSLHSLTKMFSIQGSMNNSPADSL